MHWFKEIAIYTAQIMAINITLSGSMNNENEVVDLTFRHVIIYARANFRRASKPLQKGPEAQATSTSNAGFHLSLVSPLRTGL
jgi:hypothetical protein